jgi:peptide/nickel transport system substrate-binding protein
MEKMSKIQMAVISLLLAVSLSFLSFHGDAFGATKLRITKFTDLVNVDPAQVRPDRDLAAQVYQGLVKFDFTAKPPYPIIPVLAKSYEISPGAKVITFKLQEGVQFHGGYGELTSEDVVFSLQRHQDPKVASFAKTQLKEVERIEALDKYAVRIHLKTPSALTLMSNLAWMNAGFIVSKKATLKLGKKMGLNPIGTGPFYFDRWEPAQKVVLKKFEKYWGTPARIDELEFWIVPEEIVGLGALEKGDIDIVPIQKLGSDVRAKALKDVNFVEALGSARESFFYINHKMKPMDDIRVRRALAHAMDIKGICDRLGPIISPFPSPLASATFAATDEFWRYDYNIDKAKQLLTEAGYPEGFELNVIYFKYSANEPIVLEIKSHWDKILKVNLEVIDMPLFRKRVKQFKHHVAFWNRARFAPFLFAVEYLTDSVVNYSQYSNPKLDEAAGKASSAANVEESKKYWREFQKIAAEDVTALWVGSQTAMAAINKKVKGVVLMGIPGYVELENAYIEE